MIEAPTAATTAVSRRRAGLLAAIVVLSIYGGYGLFVNIGATGGFKGDEATYYLMGHSLVRDGDLAYRKADLDRAFAEYPSGPAGVFLKRGQQPRRVYLTSSPPFLAIGGRPDPDPDRLFYGKSFIYPGLAAPFVWMFGTNGFLFFNAILLTAAFFTAYLFLSTRSGVAVGLVAAGAFVFASVVPVYFAWITPELFNFSLGLIAYFFWVHKLDGAVPSAPRSWVTGPRSDYVAALLFGLLTFSKVTNVLLFLPMLAWIIWRREWRHALTTSALFLALVLSLFAVNTAISGDWNYQGGERRTYYIDKGFPFQSPEKSFDVGDARARNEGRSDAILDPQVFWSNLRANLVYFVVGRHSGLLPYFFPGLVAILMLFLAPRMRPGWQWLVLVSVIVQGLLFVVSQPYTYFGSGGSVGNRYFMGAYGLCVFLLPTLASARVPVATWMVGGLFVSRLIMDPFDASVRPWIAPETGLVRWLPVELTNINDLPLNANRDQRIFWYGPEGDGQINFQVYYLDGNAYLREDDRSFWVRGESRAEVVIKTDRPLRQLVLTLQAGPVPANGHVRFRRRSHPFSLGAAASQQLVLDLGPGFPYKMDRELPAYMWELSITAGPGFVPRVLDPTSSDIRYLGVNVKPVITQ